MSTFSESSFSKKLAELSRNSHSIQTLSIWMVHHRKNSKEIVGLWKREVLAAKNADRLINLIFLANDVLQTSKKKGNHYNKEFAACLPELFKAIFGNENAFDEQKREDLSKRVTSDVVRNYARVLEVWRERGVFPAEFVNALKEMVEDYTVTVPTSNITTEEQEQPVMKGEIYNFDSSKFDEIEEYLKFLTNPPSQDSKTREAICELGVKFHDPNMIIHPILEAINLLQSPEYSQDPNQPPPELPKDCLEKIASLEEANRLISNYCSQLEKESFAREKVDAFLTALNTEVERQSSMGLKFSSKLQQRLKTIGEFEKGLKDKMKTLPLG